MLGGAVLGQDHFAHQHAGIAHDHAAGFEHQLPRPTGGGAGDHGGIIGGTGRCRLVTAIGHAQAAADIDALDLVAMRFQFAGQVAQFADSVFHRPQIGQLAANVGGQANWAQSGMGGGLREGGGQAFPWDAELGVGAAGADLSVCLGIDRRIDADGDLDGRAFGGSDLRQHVDLGFRFDVELQDAGFDTRGQFGAGLADA